MTIPTPRATLVFALLVLLAALVPRPVQAQNPLQLLRGIQQGGGWVSLPVTEGRATLRTDTLPTLGLQVNGCLTVWPGHSGTWELTVRDPLNDQRLDAVARPGEGVPFSYQSGSRSAVDLQVRWSQPRDTTLIVWIGVDTGDPDRDACEPVYRSQGG